MVQHRDATCTKKLNCKSAFAGCLARFKSHQGSLDLPQTGNESEIKLIVRQRRRHLVVLPKSCIIDPNAGF